MKKILIFALSAFVSQFSLAETSIVSDLKSSSAEAMSCVNGFAVASQTLGQPQYTGSQNELALSLVKLACTSDKLVISFYSAQKNSKNAKSLDEARGLVHVMIGNWFVENVESLLAAKNQVGQ